MSISTDEWLSKKREERRTKEQAFSAELESLPTRLITLGGEKRKRLTVSELPESKFSNLTKSTKASALRDYVAFDIETTGLKISSNVVELSAVHFHDFEPVELFTTLIDPGHHIPDSATFVNGITDEMVKGQPQLYEVADAFIDFIGTYPVVAHNANFDLSILQANHFDFGKRKIFDTLELSRKTLKKQKQKFDREIGCYVLDYDSDYDVEDYKLATVCEYFGIVIAGTHRSSADALACGKLFSGLCFLRCPDTRAFMNTDK